jgi:hypothetical protein
MTGRVCGTCIILASFALAALAGCQSDEIVVTVISTSSGVRFQFRYAVKSDEPVEVDDVIVQEPKSRQIVWEIVTGGTPFSKLPPDDPDRLRKRGEIVFVRLTEVAFGFTPAGFRQVTPGDKEEPVLQDNVHYRIIVLGRRGSGMTQFTTRGECQKISGSPFTMGLEEFKVRRDC